MTHDIEQFRAGFEAWFEDEYPKNEEGNREKYRNTMVMDLMLSAYAAAKLEASTEPSAQGFCLTARGLSFPDGSHITPQGDVTGPMAHAIAAQIRAGAQKDEAKGAAPGALYKTQDEIGSSTSTSLGAAANLVQELSRISMSLAADLVKGADRTIQGNDYLARMFVVDRVVQWRTEWDATRPARDELTARCRAEGGNTNDSKSSSSCGNSGAAPGDALDAREQARRLEIKQAMLQQERMKNAHLLNVLMSVYSLSPSGDDIKLPDGRVLRFNDPNAAETLNALGRVIHAIPEKAAQALASRCGCYECNPQMVGRMMFICPKCGDKRCPHASNHESECSAIATSTSKDGAA